MGTTKKRNYKGRKIAGLRTPSFSSLCVFCGLCGDNFLGRQHDGNHMNKNCGAIESASLYRMLCLLNNSGRLAFGMNILNFFIYSGAIEMVRHWVILH
jgi:hypothetical protein